METDFENYFYIDTRSLNLFRKLLSCVVIIDLLTRLSDLTAHYSGEGVLPLGVLFANHWNHWYWSLAAISDNSIFVLPLFIILLIAASFLFAGYKTRLMTIVCWAGMLSIQNRNPVIYQGGDDLLRMMLFWSVFLPLKTSSNTGHRKVNSVATMAILCQVLFAIHFSGLFKGKTEWWQEGSAIFYALSLDQIARPPGLLLSHNYSLTVVLTRCVYLIEILLFPFFLLPFYRETTRVIVGLTIAVFFTGIMLCMMIGIFPLCYLAATALFIPTSIWEKVAKSAMGIKEKTSPEFLKNVIVNKWPDAYQPNWITQSILGFLFTLVVIWNITTLPSSPIHFPYGFDPLVFSLRLNQSWGMFAPTVLKEDGWLVCKAELNDNSLIDLNANDLKLSYDKPRYVVSKFKNDRWRKFTEQLYVSGNQFLRPYYANYLISKWNNSHLNHQKKIKKLSLIFMLEISRPPNVKTTIEKITLFETNPASM